MTARSIWLGQRSGPPHETLYWRLGQNMAIRKGDWKLVKTNERSLENVDATAFADLSGAGLYNLADDIGETTDLAEQHPERVKDLAAAWQQWNAKLIKPLWGPGDRGATPSLK
jgi:arylsulfatase A-like enzyme